ncbi:hypothetical protein ASZ78_002775 [Callipepla squamata]|uniref:Uncharacterized protein n=1 Tax=Callipepla squamata TaxID=9009 RepID=A0A226NE88_CALSU|nr:hypothetical protein ASZ78_002775 [Callipepla squamata]
MCYWNKTVCPPSQIVEEYFF